MRILLLAPDSEMAEVARETLTDKSGSVEIVEALLNSALPIARRAETEGFDATVTRENASSSVRPP